MNQIDQRTKSRSIYFLLKTDETINVDFQLAPTLHTRSKF